MVVFMLKWPGICYITAPDVTRVLNVEAEFCGASRNRRGSFSWRRKATWWRSWSSKPWWGSTKSQVGSIPIRLRHFGLFWA